MRVYPPVSAATTNISGYIRCEAVSVGEDTAIAKIIRSVSDSAATKAPIARTADKVSGIFVPTVIGIALITFAVWLIAGQTVGFALARGVSVLVISCPCALGLATPVAIMVGSGVGAKNGILYKTAAALEQTGRTENAVFDKTGTVTKGEPSVTDIFCPRDEKELITAAYSLETKSEHPLSRAVCEYARDRTAALDTESFRVHAGNGISAVIGSVRYYGGKRDFIESFCGIPEEAAAFAGKVSDRGETPLYFCSEKGFLGVIAAADTIKEDSARAISELKGMGIRSVMLTGDNRRTAVHIAELAGIDEVIAGVMPDEKERTIRRLCTQGMTVMTGDGINDAPALTAADIGIAIGAGTDIAIDSADVVLMNSRLSDVPAAIRLSRAVLRNIHQNLFWAFFYNVIGIPLAAGVWIPVFGLTLDPMFGAAAMSLSSFCVVTNALRLNFTDIHSTKHDRRIKHRKKTDEKKNAALPSVTMEIEGMMCGHCEATVKKALEALPFVELAEVSHENGTAVLTLISEPDREMLKKAVEDKDYTVKEIKL